MTPKNDRSYGDSENIHREIVWAIYYAILGNKGYFAIMKMVSRSPRE